MILAKRFLFSESFMVPHASSGVALPDQWFTNLGNYVVNGQAYDCTKPGAYRWFNTDTAAFIQRALVEPGSVPGSAVEMMSAVAWCHTHGSDDDANSVQDLHTKVKTHKLRLACTPIATFLLWFLPQWNYSCRMVYVLTGEIPDGFSSGHTMLEVFDGKWKLLDPWGGVCFVNDETHLSLKEVIEFGVANCRTLPLAKDQAQTTSFNGGIDFSMIAEMFPDHNAFRRRQFQIPIIGPDRKAYLPAGLESRQSYVESLGYTVVTKAAWDAEFYP